MGNGYFSSIVARTGKKFSDTSDKKSFTLPCHISSIRLKTSGTRLNQLKNQHGKPQKLVRSVKTAGQFQQVTNLWNEMIETVVPVVIAIVTGTAVLFNKVNSRVTQLDNKVDKLELKVVESYTSKNDFTTAMIRMGDHLIRIEDKMDQLIAKKF
tara:strand:+ start:1223 stop:1684 length:462 start_codon:yes stop_codon:yes gene_type:complete